MKLTQAQLNELFEKETISSGDAKLIIVKRGEWTQEGRWQKAEVIFTDGTKNYKAVVTRSAKPQDD